VIDLCGEIINMRTLILQYKVFAEKSRDVINRNIYISSSVVYLERYFQLISFQEYLSMNNEDSKDNFENFDKNIKFNTFDDWFIKKNDINSLLNKFYEKIKENMSIKLVIYK
jgi:hypothetical protein